MLDDQTEINETPLQALLNKMTVPCNKSPVSCLRS